MTENVIWAASIFGMKRLQEEHLEIAAGIQELSNILDRAGYKVEPTETAFGELIALLQTHFLNEEVWLEGFAYPGSGTHRLQHLKLLGALKGFLEAFRAEPAQNWAHEFLGSAKDWLIFHTVHSDRIAAQFARKAQ